MAASETQSAAAAVSKSHRVLVGDCRELMRQMDDASIDAIVTDPPYELGFMGKRWDASGIAYDVNVWRECLRVLKPGGHLLAFGGTRTYHRMACAIEDAGFEVRDSLHWIYGSGFPKSLDVSKAIDKAAGVEREVVTWRRSGGGRTTAPNPMDRAKGQTSKHDPITAPATDAARQWAGWGTALKPAHEPIVVARKPLDGTVAANVLKHGTGAINVDACRVGTSKNVPASVSRARGLALSGSVNGSLRNQTGEESGFDPNVGRWPPNVLLSHSPECGDECAEDCAVAEMDRQGDSAKFFPCFHYGAKAGRKEREAGCENLPARSGAQAVERVEGSNGMNSPRAGAGRTASEIRNHHPTVKSISVMRWLVRLVTPPNGTVLDPFAGSGTTGVACAHEGFEFVGFEQSAEYAAIARARIGHG